MENRDQYLPEYPNRYQRRTLPGRMDKQCYFRVFEEEKDELNYIARLQGLTFSQLVRKTLADAGYITL